jgi:hypothetical protein
VSLVENLYINSNNFQQNCRDLNNAIVEFLYLTRLPKLGFEIEPCTLDFSSSIDLS